MLDGRYTRTSNALTWFTWVVWLSILLFLWEHWGISGWVPQGILPVWLRRRLSQGLRLEGKIIVCLCQELFFQLLFILLVTLWISIKSFKCLFFATALTSRFWILLRLLYNMYCFLDLWRGMMWWGVGAGCMRSENFVYIIYWALTCWWDKRESILSYTDTATSKTTWSHFLDLKTQYFSLYQWLIEIHNAMARLLLSWGINLWG